MSLRVLILVTHLLGAGHLTRAAAIGRALARRGHRVTLLSGGTSSPLVSTEGLDFIQLPPVRTKVGDFTTLLDEGGQPIGAVRLAARREAVLAAFADCAPQVVVTELYPFGRRVLSAEFEALLAGCEDAVPRPIVLASVRDILVAPEKPAKLAATRATLARHYAAVLVHGDETALPLDRSWPVDDALRERLIYTGYVGPDASLTAFLPPCGEGGPERSGGSALPTRGREGAPGTILVSGGSSSASLPLYRAALLAAADSDRPWHLLIGAAVPAEDFDALRRAAPPPVIVERARADFRALLTEASVFVGQSGYNTVMDIVATGCRAVLVPFEQGRETEQRLRAEGLAEARLATLLPEAVLTSETLLAAIAEAETRPPSGPSTIRLDGQERAALAIERLAAGMPAFEQAA